MAGGDRRRQATVPDTALESALSRARLAVVAASLLAMAGGALAWPRAEPQAPRHVHRIGVLNEAWAANHPTVEGLKAGLRDRGLEEGRDVSFSIRFTEGKSEAMPAAAQALLRAGADLIFTTNEAATIAAKEATQTIPIVFALVGDPVATGLVKKLAQPGGNLTGVSKLTPELMPKRLELLKRLTPAIRRVWFIYYGGDLTASAALVKALEASPRLGVDLVPRTVLTAEQLTRLLKELRPGDGLLAPDIDTLDIPAVLLEASLVSRIPAVFPATLWVEHGGLVSYGPDYHAHGVQAARLVAKILAGARPQDLPVEAAEKIDLAVNLKTAALLGTSVPRKLLLRADTVRR